MTDDQENKLSMYIKVSDFLEAKAATLADITQIADIQTALDENIEDITTAEGTASSDTTGFTQQKKNASVALQTIMIKVSRAAASYFFTINNPGMLKLADYLPSELLRLRDGELYIRAKQLFKIADPVKANLTGFKSGPADVADLDTKKEAYFNVLQLPEAKRTEKTASGKDVDKEMADTDKLLEGLDLLMSNFEADNLNLYNQYLSSRAIDNMTGGGGGETILLTVQNTLAMGATGSAGLIPAGTQKVRFTGITGGPLESGRSTNQTTFNGNTTTLSAPAVTTSDLSYYGATGDYIIVKNQNITQPAEYKIEFLG